MLLLGPLASDKRAHPAPDVFFDQILDSLSDVSNDFRESVRADSAGTSYAMPHSVQVLQMYWKRVMTKTLGSEWDHLVETPATPVELEAFKQLACFDQAWKQIDKNAYMKAIDRYLGAIDETLVLEPYFDDDDWPNSHLLAVLRAKFLRRVTAEKYAHVRTRLRGSLARPRHETGSAAATAKRMNPLGAPPLNA